MYCGMSSYGPEWMDLEKGWTVHVDYVKRLDGKLINPWTLVSDVQDG